MPPSTSPIFALFPAPSMSVWWWWAAQSPALFQDPDFGNGAAQASPLVPPGLSAWGGGGAEEWMKSRLVGMEVSFLGGFLLVFCCSCVCARVFFGWQELLLHACCSFPSEGLGCL